MVLLAAGTEALFDAQTLFGCTQAHLPYTFRSLAKNGMDDSHSQRSDDVELVSHPCKA